jgi:hypothetical protein
MDVYKIDDYEIVKNFIVSTYNFLQIGSQIVVQLYNKYDKRYVLSIQLYMWYDCQCIDYDGCEIKLFDEKNNIIDYSHIIISNLKRFLENHIWDKYYNITNDGKEPILTMDDITIGLQCCHLSLKEFYDNADLSIRDCVDKMRYYIDIHYNSDIEKTKETQYFVRMLTNTTGGQQFINENFKAMFKKYNVPHDDRIYIVSKYMKHISINSKRMNDILDNTVEYYQNISQK